MIESLFHKNFEFKRAKESSVKVGDIVTCSFAILSKKRSITINKKNIRIQKKKYKKKKRYTWSLVHFSGACIKIKKNIITLQNYSNLNSFTFICLINSPNLISWYVWSKKIRTPKRSLLFTVKKHQAIIRRLRFN